MLKFTQLTDDANNTIIGTATLTYDQRQKTRSRVQLDDGNEVGLFLPRGNSLKHGDIIQSESGECVLIHAAKEAVSRVYCEDALLLSKICYHLGNRHVPLQIDRNRVCYQIDHVLDDMVAHFNLSVTHEQTAFEPEHGAYHGHHSHE